MLDHTAFALINVEPTNAPRIKLFGGLPKGTRGAIALVGRSGDELTGTPTIALTRLPKGGDGTAVLTNPGQLAGHCSRSPGIVRQFAEPTVDTIRVASGSHCA